MKQGAAQEFTIENCLVTINAHTTFELGFDLEQAMPQWLVFLFRHLGDFGISNLKEINISFLTATMIQTTNLNYRNKNKSTNVLSFAYHDDHASCFSGEILFCPEVVVAELSLWPGQTLLQHYFHLLVHAVLHLLGYTHDTPKNEARMRLIECQTIGLFNHPDPYVITK